MTRLSQNAYRIRDMAFVRAHRLQGCGFANDRAVRAQSGSFREVASSRHAGLFVSSGQNVQGFFQFRDVDITQRVEDKGEEAFHVRRTQTIQLIVMLG